MLKRPLIIAGVIAAAAATASAQPVGQRIAFVSCPILRNTEPVPCWLGEHRGQLYYLGPQGDLQAEFYPPQFNHRMLAEGVVTGETYCGGLVLKQAKASVLPDIDPACNVMLPAMGYKESDKLRGPGPSGHRGEVEPPRPRPPEPPAPTPPYKAQEFTALFDADTDRMWRQAQASMTSAARYARDINARTVTVTGHRAAIRLIDGKDYVERQEVAESRAKVIAEALKVAGLPAGAKVETRWVARPLPSNGTERDAASRKVVISVAP